MTGPVRRRFGGLAACAALLAWSVALPGCGQPAHDGDGGEDAAVPTSFQDGVAVAIVYDTSGSMGEATKLMGGGTAPKYVVANKALADIVARLETWAAGGAGGAPRRVEAGLYAFAGDDAREVLPMGPLDAKGLERRIASLSKPDGPTPLGPALRLAGLAALRAPLSRKHVLVVTDGEANRGAAPAEVLADLARRAERAKTTLASHFIAFDVAAAVFAPVKARGATLLTASDEAQLNEQLGYILEKKILLEEEEVPPSPAMGG